MAKEGYGWEDIRVRLKVPTLTAQMIVFGRSR